MPPEAKPLWRIYSMQLAVRMDPCLASTMLPPPLAPPLSHLIHRAPAHANNPLCSAVTGTRNYTCQTQTLSFGPSLGVGNITGQLANGTVFTCDWFYNSAFSDIVACRTNGSTDEFWYSLDTTVLGAGALHTAAYVEEFQVPPRQRCRLRFGAAWASPHGAGHAMRLAVKLTLQAFTFVA